MHTSRLAPRGALLGLAASSALIAGCGGGGVSDFQAKVNSICRNFNQQTKSLDVNKPSDVKTLSSAVDSTNKQLAGVKANSDVQKKYGGTYTQFVANFNQEAYQTGVVIGLLRRGDKAAAQQAAQQVTQLNDKSKALAKQLGLADCQK